MAALTAIRNPARPTETLLLFCSEDQQVALSIINDKKPGDDLRGGKDDDAVPDDDGVNLRVPVRSGEEPGDVSGLVKHPGAFVSMYINDLIRVYGIRSNGVISLVSPGVAKLVKNPKTKKNALAGCGNGTDRGWLYYLNTQDPPALTQYRLWDYSTEILGPQTQPDPETSLSAYYKEIDGSRCCVYQLVKDTTLMYNEVTSRGASNNGTVDNSDNAAKKTPLCTVVIRDTVFLYYINRKNKLIRCKRTGGSSAWTDSVEAPTNIWNLGPLAAVASLDGQTISVWQAIEDDDEFMHWTDQVAGLA